MGKSITARSLKLIELLSQKENAHTVYELADILHVDSRTIFRDMVDLKTDGYIIEHQKNSTYIITGYFPEASAQSIEDSHISFNFTPHEFSMFKMLLDGMVDSKLGNNTLAGRIAMMYKAGSSQLNVLSPEHSRFIENVKLLNEAITTRQTVRICDYQSGQSNKKSCYEAEPFQFTDNLKEVMVYDTAGHRTISLKISRIGSIQLLGYGWSCQQYHNAGHMDLFRMVGDVPTMVHLKLSLLARNLLLEEFPGSSQYLEELPDGCHFKCPVYNMKGIGRFVAGLADQIEIIDSPELTDYIRSFRTHLDRIIG